MRLIVFSPLYLIPLLPLAETILLNTFMLFSLCDPRSLNRTAFMRMDGSFVLFCCYWTMGRQLTSGFNTKESDSPSFSHH